MGIERDLARLCGPLEGAADLFQRIRLARAKRESDGTPLPERIAYALVECALRHFARLVPAKLAPGLFLHLIERGCRHEAALLALCTEGGALKLAMWERLPQHADELERTLAAYPGRVPATLEPARPDSRETFEQFVAWARERAERYSWSRSVAALAASPGPVSIPEEWERERLFAAGEHEELVRRLSSDELIPYARAMLDRGEKLPASVIGRVETSPEPEKKSARLARLGVLAIARATRRPAFFEALSALAPKERGREVAWWVRAGGPVEAVREAAVLPDEVAGEVWCGRVLETSTTKEARRAFRDLLRLGALRPRSYALCHAAIRAMARGEAPPPEFDKDVERRRGATKAPAIETVNDLDGLQDPFSVADAVDRLPRAEIYQRVLKRLAPGTILPLAFAIGRILATERLPLAAIATIERSLLFVEALVYHIEEREDAYLDLVRELSPRAPKEALELLTVLPLVESHRARLAFEYAYRTENGTALRTAAAALGIAPLAEAVVAVTRNPEKARGFWLAAAKLSLDARADALWCVVGLLLASKLELADLDAIRSYPRPNGHALVTLWRRAAGALSEDPEEAPIVRLLELPGDAVEPALRELSGGRTEMRGESLPPLEQQLVRRLRKGHTVVPFDVGAKLQRASSIDELHALAANPGLGGDDAVFCATIADRVLELGEQAGAPLERQVVDTLLELPALGAGDAVRALLAGGAPHPRLAELVRRLPFDALVGLQEPLLYFHALHRSPELTAALGERSALLALRATATIPSGAGDAVPLRKLVERALKELEQWTAAIAKLPPVSAEKRPPRWENSGHMRSHPEILTVMQKLTSDVPYVIHCYTFYFNPNLAKPSCVRSSSHGLEAQLSNGAYTVKLGIETTAKTEKERLAAIADLDGRLRQLWK